MTDTRGAGILNSYLSGYEPYHGDFPIRFTGSIVADRQGKGVPYALFNFEPKGILFIIAGERVYKGMIIGEHNRDSDLNVNPCKEKKLTNHRASRKYENVVLTPIIPMNLQRAIEIIHEGEIVEVTPANNRLRKVLLSVTGCHTGLPPKS